MYYGAANRDPRVSDHPRVFDITRKPTPHIVFRTGPHFWMGSQIAKLEMRGTLKEFFRRFPNVHLLTEP
jgi:cytochrome P450